MVAAEAAKAAGRQRLAAWADRFRAAAGKAADKAAGKVEVQEAVKTLLCADCCWRDILLLSWDLRTVEGKDGKGGAGAVAAALAADLASAAPVELLELVEKDGPSGPGTVGSIEISGGGDTASGDSEVSGWFRAQTAVARGMARVTLRHCAASGGDDRCAVLFTSMTELRGHEEPVGARRPLGHELEAAAPKRRRTAAAAAAEEPFVLIVGGSQSGLMLGARLKRMGVPFLVVERNERPGDTWRNRYGSLHLHDPIWICHLPYLPLPEHWPVYVSKDQFADWLDVYAKVMEVDFQGGTDVRKASYDAQAKRWTVQVSVAGGSELRTLRPAHLVMASGNTGTANVPELPGMDSFLGEVVHSSRFSSAGVAASNGASKGEAAWKGRRCVVVGSNTSAHDIVQDLYEHGADVTMLQRSPTCVLPTTRMRELAASAGYSEEALARGVDAAEADLAGAATPFRGRVAGAQSWVRELKEKDAEYYRRLEKAGWQQTWGSDSSGPYMMFLRAFRGYYFDIGACGLVMDGKVRLKSGVSVSEVRPKSVVLTSGEEVPCDFLVLATGYKNMTDIVANLISPEVARAVGPCWGLGSGASSTDPAPWQGELRNMWKPTAQPGLWFQGGNIGMCRFHSLHLALQLKARFEGIVNS